MASSRVKLLASALVVSAALSAPSIASAQRYVEDEPSVVVECGPGQRAVMEQRRVNGSSTLVARCVGASRVAARQSQSVERAPRRTKTKTALMIAGGAASGAGVGGALKGGRGALIGAAIGGGAASIYEAAKRR